MTQILSSLQSLFSTKSRICAYIILVLAAGLLWWYTTDIAIMFGNYGTLHTYADIVLSMIMIFGFPLFILAVVYRGLLFGNRSNLDGKTGIGAIGGIIGTIMSGCSCCGLTLASYFGLLPLMGFLPYDGLEIKIIGTAGLVYALIQILGNLQTCKIKTK
jgi:hypothetical protein